MATKIYGVFSQKQADQFGTVIWRTPDGNEVEVTCVSYSETADEIHFADKRVVGEVVEHVRGSLRPARKSRMVAA